MREEKHCSISGIFQEKLLIFRVCGLQSKILYIGAVAMQVATYAYQFMGETTSSMKTVLTGQTDN